jgi:hypothetical protein
MLKWFWIVSTKLFGNYVQDVQRRHVWSDASKSFTSNTITVLEKRHQHPTKNYLNNLRLQPLCKWDVRSSGLSRRVDWQLPTFRYSLTLKIRPKGCAETSLTTSVRWVTSQKNEVVKSNCSLPNFIELRQRRGNVTTVHSGATEIVNVDGP